MTLGCPHCSPRVSYYPADTTLRCRRCRRLLVWLTHPPDRTPDHE